MLPKGLPADAPLMKRVHDHMFRACVLQLSGDERGMVEQQQAFSLLREGLINTIADEKQMPRLNVYRDQIVWGRSPVRIDLAGGWTDTPPYCMREHALRRFVFIDIAKYLGIRNDKLRCFFQYRKRRYQLIGRHTHNQAFLIEKFAQSLHLRQNQPSLGCLDVLRHHEKHQILPVDQCPGDEAAAVILRQFADQCFF